MSSILFVISAVIFSIVLPIYLLYWIYRGTSNSKVVLLSKIVGSGLFLYMMYLFNYWAVTSYYLRYIYLIFFAASAVIAWWRVYEIPWWKNPDLRGWGSITAGVLLSIFSGLFLWQIAGSDRVSGQAAEIQFPFESGTFYAVRAGSTRAMNGHMAMADNPEYRGQMYALDITKLGYWGNRAIGLYPSDPERYFIFGTPVTAPCEGTITALENDLPDLSPPDRDSENLPGNYVQIHCDEGFYLLLAHLREGSIRVETGRYVNTGDVIGEIGNSGNTSEPHLHIHAQNGPGGDSLLNAEPIPIVFIDFGWLRQNDVVQVK